MQLLHPGGSLDLAAPVVMGVLNVTPDSFSDGGRFAAPDAAIAHGLQLVAEGAAILDCASAAMCCCPSTRASRR